MFDLGKVAILCIHKNQVSSIEKIEGFNHHIQYYIELSKRDAIIQEVLSHYNVPYLIENPTEVQRTIHTELVSAEFNACLILSVAPQITMPTTIFFAIMPEQINDFQKK